MNPSQINIHKKNPSAEDSKQIDDLLSQMTLEEKIGQLTQGHIDSDAPESFEQEVRDGIVGSYILNQGGRALADTLQKTATTDSRLEIPLLLGFDTIHGYRTVFPISLALSCAWEPELYERSQTIAARESRADGVHWVFGPMCDIARDPRWGRVSESCGEDPYLASLCVVASVSGLQGSDISAPNRVAACLKHFVGYGASIGGRDYNATEIPVFTMRNLHLLPFRAGIAAGAATVMSAFNANDGIPAVCDRTALTDILRSEWGFEGFVVSDWDAVRESISWGYNADETEAAQRALNAGNDMDMVSRIFQANLPALVKDGSVTISEIDTAVRRILGVKLRLGLFDETAAPLPVGKKLPSDAIELARECATRSMVLLENDGVLPLKSPPADIALIGPFSTDPVEMLGAWTLKGLPEDVITLDVALRDSLPPGSILNTVTGCPILEEKERTSTLTNGKIVTVGSAEKTNDTSDSIVEAVEAAKNSDLVIMTLGEPADWSGENACRTSLRVSGRQQELFDAVAATGKPIIVILFCGRPLVFPEITQRASAVLMAWHPGVQAGPAIADILLGIESPSARLTMSFPTDEGQLPVYYNRLKTGRSWAADYRDMTREPAYPFGYGLTYASFVYSSISCDGNHASVTITNQGKRPGIETVQLYIRALSCSEGARPEKELRGFQRVELEPDESKKITFALTDETLGFTARDGTERVEDVSYYIWISPDSASGDEITFKKNS